MSKSIVHVPWTDEHLAILRSEFPKGIAYAMKALPKHTEGAIRTRASNLGIKLTPEAQAEARGPNEQKIIAALRANQGMKISEIAKRTGYTVPSLHNRMTQMKNRGVIYCEGTSIRTIWFAEKPAPTFEVPAEYVKVSSIFRVAERVARMTGQV